MICIFVIVASLLFFRFVHSQEKVIKEDVVSKDINLCIASSCQTLTPIQYVDLKSKYKYKIKNKDVLTYSEYQELVKIIDIEAKKNTIILRDFSGEVTVDKLLGAIK